MQERGDRRLVARALLCEGLCFGVLSLRCDNLDANKGRQGEVVARALFCKGLCDGLDLKKGRQGKGLRRERFFVRACVLVC